MLIRFVVDQVIPPIEIPADDEYVKRFRIQSALLTKWWGHPIYLGATVLLPRGYAEHPDVRYPVVYSHGHFSLRAPGGGATAAWLGDSTPRVILVTLQHPSPFYDDSYAVNSPNQGPYDDAIMQGAKFHGSPRDRRSLVVTAAGHGSRNG